MVPTVTVEQMRAVDRLMIERYQIALVQMMENAGRNLAHLARERFCAGDPIGAHVVVLAGTGGNGGGALVCARHLGNWGARVIVALARPAAEYTGVPAHQLTILRRMNVPLVHGDALDALENPALIVDGLIGYSLRGAPRGTAAAMIRWANARSVPVLALDTPSGLDATTGDVSDPTVVATVTMTLALPKAGLFVPEAATHVGERYLADIGVPPSLYLLPPIGLHVDHLFSASEIIRLQ